MWVDQAGRRYQFKEFCLLIVAFNTRKSSFRALIIVSTIYGSYTISKVSVRQEVTEVDFNRNNQVHPVISNINNIEW